jgi:hypothetical protein
MFSPVHILLPFTFTTRMRELPKFYFCLIYFLPKELRAFLLFFKDKGKGLAWKW